MKELEKSDHYVKYQDVENTVSYHGTKFSYRQYVPDDTACGALLVRIRELCIEKNYRLAQIFKHGDAPGSRKRWSVAQYVLIDLNQKCRTPFWSANDPDKAFLPIYKTNFCNVTSHTYRSQHFQELMWLAIALEKQTIDFIVAEPYHPRMIFDSKYTAMIEDAYQKTVDVELPI